MIHNILVTICARGGSKGIKNKNIRILAGHPLISYTIKQAKLWNKARHIVVSTDSPEIGEIAKQYGAEVPFLRPSDLATDSAPKVPVIRHALFQAERIFGERYDPIVDLDPTAPVRTINDLNECLEQFLREQPNVLFSAVSAYKNPYFNMFELDARGNAILCKKLPSLIYRRQDAPKVYQANSSMYFFKRSYLSDPTVTSVLSENSKLFILDDTASIDIDREIDFRFIEFLVKEGIISL